MPDLRQEGGYVSRRIEDAFAESIAFFTIDRVGGDGSVISVEFTRGEAESVLMQLRRQLADTRGET